MQMYEIIHAKKQGRELTPAQIRFAVDGFTSGVIPNYQMSALLMAICLQGMSKQETSELTMAMVSSGDVIDLSMLEGQTFDKHSTGGVGDKTTFIVAPILAALGLKVPKMSGRGLGHTGGTIDKLASIPGMRTDISTAQILQIVAQHGLCMAGQTKNLVPADKAIYALRDVTATVDSIPLIAASIMSKKIATGAQHIMLDVKCGNGAFMKDISEARALAEAMVDIGNACGRKTAALITDMSEPLGYAVGNGLEIIEAVQLLSGCKDTPRDLLEICTELCAYMLHMAGKGSLDTCRMMVGETITSGAALKKFADMVEAQGGDRSYIEDTSRFEVAKFTAVVRATQSGYVSEVDTAGIGIAAMNLGAGREKPEDEICYSAGIVLHVKKGAFANAGEPIATLYTNRPEMLEIAERKVLDAVKLAEGVPTGTPLILGSIG